MAQISSGGPAFDPVHQHRFFQQQQQQAQAPQPPSSLTAVQQQAFRTFAPLVPDGSPGSSSFATPLIQQDWHPDHPEAQYWVFSDFEQLETLGTGTFGRVRLCRHRLTGTFYALKVLHKSDIIRLKQVDHVMAEKSILFMLDHPFLVKLFKTFQDEANLYMIMEYVIGGEIFSHLRRAGKFPNDVTRFYTAQIILALEYLHSKDVVYRDLKPENLLLDVKGNIKITDFGFAKIVHDRTYTLCGTPEYLSPEIIQCKGHNKSTDWWALGILVFEMLVGFPPFFDESPFRIYEKILAGVFESPRSLDPNAKDLIRRFLIADRSKRLGGGKEDAHDVKLHKWFRGVDWSALLHKEICAPIPVRVSHEGDTRYYEKYPEDSPTRSLDLPPEAQRLFDGF